MAMTSDTQDPLLPLNDTVEGVVDYNGNPAIRSRSGRWRSASFIIGVEVAERTAFYGITSNLITYLTSQLGQTTATAAENVNLWSGTAALLPLLGAFVADSFLGRYRTIIVASAFYILGLGLLTLSAMLPSHCDTITHNKMAPCSASPIRVAWFMLSLYLVALAQGGQKPCLQAFGADQFDGQDPEECKAKSSFFNWWFFSICGGTVLSVFVINCVQDYISWGLGFGILAISMLISLLLFLLGAKTYRHTVRGCNGSPFSRICRVYINAVRNWRAAPPTVAYNALTDRKYKQFSFLNKALVVENDSKRDVKVCSMSEVEEAKAMVSLLPIWVTSLGYAIAYAQVSTFFVKQGTTMDRSLLPGLQIPAASLQSFISIGSILFVPIYDRIFIPIARAYTRKPSGITPLQRVGTGMLLTVTLMVIAAAVEMKRLKMARDYGLVNEPNATIPMSIWWLVPQYMLLGASGVFTIVGLQEFFYDQAPSELKSMGFALCLSIFGVGSFLNSILIYVIEEATCGEGRDSWFSDNLNRARLDCFYWLLAGINEVGLIAFMCFC